MERAVLGGDDAALVREVATGSHAALAMLYDRHASLVFATARRITGDRTTAEDVVQETFLVLWNRAELFDPAVGSLATWLTAIARNRSLDRVRATRRRPRPVSIGEPGSGAATEDELERAFAAAPGERGEPDPAMSLVRAEDREAVRRAVATLGDTERAVIILAYQEGLTQTEIAERLGWPIGTVKTRTRRALRVMRAALVGLDADATEQDASDAQHASDVPNAGEALPPATGNHRGAGYTSLSATDDTQGAAPRIPTEDAGSPTASAEPGRTYTRSDGPR